MYLLTNRSSTFLLKYPSLSRLIRASQSHTLPPSSFTYYIVRDASRYCRLRRQKSMIDLPKATKRSKSSLHHFNDRDHAHISWWKERLENCRKPSTMHLVKRLVYCNLLGLNIDLKNGSLKEGSLNWEILQFKSKFPREVLLCRVGEFYEALGIDACILVEYAGLNPFGGLRTDSIPRAGCPVVNLRQTLDDLTSNGYSVCIVEELQGPAQARTRKSRFISGHAHPGSPYVFGLVGDDCDLDFPEPMPVAGISRSASGYCLIKVLETMKTYSIEDGLTEEALVTKLRTCRFHHLFLHTSLRNDSSATSRWGEYGECGLLWGECNGKHFEWFEGNPVTELLFKVKELYGFGIDENVEFRNVTVSTKDRPHPLHLGTATQIGVIPSEGIPSLLKILLPSNCNGLPVLYIRDLLLNPPTYEVASSILEICRLINTVTCSIPDFTCIPSAKIVKLLETRETNHIEFSRIKNVVDEVLFMHNNVELKEILKLLMDPTWVATGLKIDVETLVDECKAASEMISEMIYLNDESNQKISSFPNVPQEFFEDMESSWKGRVKRVHIEDHFKEVNKAARELSLAVFEDFLPIIARIKATAAPLGGPKGEILYAKEHESVWFKGKRFTPSVWGDTPGETQIKQLKPAVDSKGRKVGEEWFTTPKVEAALLTYHEANEKARSRFLELLRQLSADLQPKINVLVFSSMLLVVSKALFCHVSEGRRRKWVFPCLTLGSKEMKLTGLFPYWLEPVVGTAVRNTVLMESLFLLTGPNGGGKSSLLRSVCAASLLGICGLMVPADSALIPHFDSIMLHMKSYDSPVDGKSSFQVEMSEIRSILSATSSKSLVLVDEICRGTETAKGTCIAGSVVETLDQIGCLGIVSTHLHGIFDLPLKTQKTVYKAMESVHVDGRTIPTWHLVDGVCKESLAFETARREGLSDAIIQRAQGLYANYTDSPPVPTEFRLDSYRERAVFDAIPDVKNLVGLLCQRKLVGMFNQKYISELELVELNCVAVCAGEKPPPSAVGCSCVYVMTRPDRRLYVGVTDDIESRMRAHRAKEGLQDAAFVFMKVPGKSIACLLETYLIKQLPCEGFNLSNLSDGKHRNFGTVNGIVVH